MDNADSVRRRGCRPPPRRNKCPQTSGQTQYTAENKRVNAKGRGTENKRVPPGSEGPRLWILAELLVLFRHLKEGSVPGVDPHLTAVGVHTQHPQGLAFFQGVESVVAWEDVGLLPDLHPR